MHVTPGFTGRESVARVRGRSLALAVATLAACSGNVDGPLASGGAEEHREVSTLDPRDDTFGNSDIKWDVVALAIGRDRDGVTLRIEFTRDVVSPLGRAPAGVIAFVDLDLDQNPATGRRAVADDYRLDDGYTALGVERTIDLTGLAVDGSATVYGATGDSIGRLVPEYAGRTVSLRLPTALLGGDDGFVNGAVIVGTTGSPSDIAPNSGHLALMPASGASRVLATPAPFRTTATASRAWASFQRAHPRHLR
jgi:hypothetical protein